MKKLLLITLILLLTNCSTTQLVDTWRNPDVTEFSTSKILIVGMTSDTKARKRFEKQLTDEYLSRGIDAVMSINVLESSITSNEKSEEENIELLKKYIRDKEAQLVTAFNRDELITEILIKNGFKLNYTLTKQEAFKKNEILLASDGDKETLICLDVTIADETVEHFKTHTDKN